MRSAIGSCTAASASAKQCGSTAAVESELRELAELAPLHQPKSLAALDAVSEALPQLPAVACFDTAFHARCAPAASTYALPAEWRERWHLRRYGFHGLSHSWVARRAPELLGRDERGTADRQLPPRRRSFGVRDLRRRARSTRRWASLPLEGLVMATRSGA